MGVQRNEGCNFLVNGRGFIIVCGISPEGIQTPAVTQIMSRSSLKKGGRETHFLGWRPVALQLHFRSVKGKWAKTIVSRSGVRAEKLY